MVLSIASTAALADLPLTVEDLFTDKGKYKLDVSLSYANSDRHGISTGEPVTVQTGVASFITIPTALGESHGNSDYIVSTLGLRYGLSVEAEIYARGSYLHSSQRHSGVFGTSSSSADRFSDAWVGLNYQFKKEDDIPALLGFSEIALAERNRVSSSSFKSGLMGLSAYQSIDPVVISFTTAYQFNRSRKDGSAAYKPGNFFLASPSIAFAVNEKVTLNTGLQWKNQQASQLDGATQGFRHTSTYRG
ncbi:MAG: hypothetical protein ABWY08_07130 [Comamonas sp.]